MCGREYALKASIDVHITVSSHEYPPHDAIHVSIIGYPKEAHGLPDSYNNRRLSLTPPPPIFLVDCVHLES
jgi:hypothetical protein